MKYQPHAAFRATRSRVEDRIYEALSTGVKNAATEEYSKFITTLPQRNPENVIATIRKQTGLRERLQREADDLQGWLR